MKFLFVHIHKEIVCCIFLHTLSEHWDEIVCEPRAFEHWDEIACELRAFVSGTTEGWLTAVKNLVDCTGA
jgi:hypothetical protein